VFFQETERAGLRALGKTAAMHNKKPNSRKLHQDWRTWLVVALMLVAIGMYVLTLDDSIVPINLIRK
jgi:hypothetical protein